MTNNVTVNETCRSISWELTSTKFVGKFVVIGMSIFLDILELVLIFRSPNMMNVKTTHHVVSLTTANLLMTFTVMLPDILLNIDNSHPRCFMAAIAEELVCASFVFFMTWTYTVSSFNVSSIVHDRYVCHCKPLKYVSHYGNKSHHGGRVTAIWALGLFFALLPNWGNGHGLIKLLDYGPCQMHLELHPVCRYTFILVIFVSNILILYWYLYIILVLYKKCKYIDKKKKDISERMQASRQSSIVTSVKSKMAGRVQFSHKSFYIFGKSKTSNNVSVGSIPGKSKPSRSDRLSVRGILKKKHKTSNHCTQSGCNITHDSSLKTYDISLKTYDIERKEPILFETADGYDCAWNRTTLVTTIILTTIVVPFVLLWLPFGIILLLFDTDMEGDFEESFLIIETALWIGYSNCIIRSIAYLAANRYYSKKKHFGHHFGIKKPVFRSIATHKMQNDLPIDGETTPSSCTNFKNRNNQIKGFYSTSQKWMLPQKIQSQTHPNTPKTPKLDYIKIVPPSTCQFENAPQPPPPSPAPKLSPMRLKPQNTDSGSQPPRNSVIPNDDRNDCLDTVPSNYIDWPMLMDILESAAATTGMSLRATTKPPTPSGQNDNSTS